MIYKIWDLVPDNVLFSGDDDPRSYDFSKGLTVRLHQKLSIESGLLMSVEYYKDYDGETYGDLIVKCTIVWNYEGRLVSRIEKYEWAIKGEDLSFGPHVKETTKYYNEEQAAVADSRRRENIITELTSLSQSFGVLSYVQTMFRALDNELNAYTKTGDPKIIEKIGAYSGKWLDAPFPDREGVTLRMAIIGQLI